MSDKNPNIDELSGTETTGHEWDGIEELNTPMPRWWLWVFYASIVVALLYAIAMPSIPLLNSHFKGVLGHSDRAAVNQEMEEMQARRAVFATKLLDTDLETIQADPELFRFAMAAGKSAFGDNCATCHGSGAQGFKGYPNLNDDIWLWGGSFEDILHTLNVGIRATHEDTRIGLMQAYGRDGLLTADQISDLAHYVQNLSGNGTDAEAALRAAPLFQDTCSTCHGTTGMGDRAQGAPNLTDAEWLYGGSYADITQTLYAGRQGVMPNWNERLTPETISALAVYVHSLGGGEDTPPINTENLP
jgi:cytochrome c oxidase cbb3-type subunit 3